jgi:uncharacterized membrane protein YphA (DoxX/SURF4 family)
MLSSIFIAGGINALKAPQGHAQAAKPVLDAVAPAVDKAVEVAPIEQRPDDEMLIKIDAGVKIVAGSMLAVGKFPRLAATALAASMVPTTMTHQFWTETDPSRKADQQIQFLKNVSLLGGLLIAAADTEGKPSLGWRGRRAARLASVAATERAGAISGAAHDVSGRVSGTASQASGRAAGVAAGLAGLAPGAAASARAADLREDWSKRAAKAAKKAEKRRAAMQKQAAKRGADLQKQAARRRADLEKKAPAYADAVTTQASRFGHDVAARASRVGTEVAHAAEGVAKDARKRAHALTH